MSNLIYMPSALKKDRKDKNGCGFMFDMEKGIYVKRMHFDS